MKNSFMLVLCLLAFMSAPATGQIVLSGNSYTENFDSLGSGLPSGWGVYTGATSSSLGTEVFFNTDLTAWGNTSAAFKNFASANNPGANASDSSAVQSAYTDRALGVRQGASFGDPGAAFVAEIAGTTGFSSFGLTLDLQMLSVQTRSTLWTIDYRIGTSGMFTSIGTYSDPGLFGSTTQTFNFGNALDNQAESVYIRVAALSATTGTGSRDSFGIDNFSMSYTPVPEPHEYACVAGLGLIIFAVFRRWKMRARQGHTGNRSDFTPSRS
jgi:hypothetical protein